jgi:hypothetical protein
MRHLMATDVRPVCFGMVSWIPGNGFVGQVLACFALFPAVNGRPMVIPTDGQISSNSDKNSIKTIL